MLKWTVSKRSDVADLTAAVDCTASTNTTATTFFAAPRDHNRRHHQRSKENATPCIATPQPLTMSQLIATSTPYGSQEALSLRRTASGTAAATTATTQPLDRTPRPVTATIAPHRKRNAYASTLPTFEVEYSPMAQRSTGADASKVLRGLTIPESFFGNARYFQHPPQPTETSATMSNGDGPPALKRRRVLQQIDCPIVTVDEQPDDANQSSRALDDVELSRLIDDILHSRRKPIPITTSTHERRKRLFDHDEDFDCVSHKPIVPTVTANKPAPVVAATASHPSRTPPQTMNNVLESDHNHHLHAKLQTQHLYPEHPYLRETIELLAGMTTPPEAPSDATVSEHHSLHHRPRGSSASSVTGAERSPVSLDAQAQKRNSANGTPTGPEQIRRCLLFPESPESIGSETWLLKRQSVASTISTTSSRCSTRSASASSCVSGTLNVAVRANGAHIEVHVIRCKDLQRNHAGPTAPINAYVKVAKLAAGRSIPDTGFQRTRVHRDSTEPFFNHRFILDAPPAQQTATLGERIQLTVWHRDGESKRSEFLGCLAFPMRSILERSIFGAFALRPQAYLSAVEPAEPEPIAAGCHLTKQVANIVTDDACLPFAVRETKQDDQPAKMKKCGQHRSDYGAIESYLADERCRGVDLADCNGHNVETRYAPSLCVG